MQYRRSRTYASMLLMITVWGLLHLPGCGFHLRGAVQIPAAFERTYIQGNPYSDLVTELRRSLRTAGVDIVDKKEDATGVLRILDDRFSRRVLSVGSDSKVLEFELHYQVRIDVRDNQGQELIPVQSFVRVQGYLNDETDVLGKGQEEALLRREMQRDLVRSILRRLHALSQTALREWDALCKV